MKFYEKYPKLKEKDFLVGLLTSNVYSTMLLENQIVSLEKVANIVEALLIENELKGSPDLSKLGQQV